MKTFTKIASTLLFFQLISSCSPSFNDDAEKRGQSGAAQALDQWTFSRAYPFGTIPIDKLTLAFAQRNLEIQLRDNENDNWEALGPKNIGGRTLCLTFHPNNPDIIYAGSASGGLWKTTSAGVGVAAWERIPTGFPALAVASIAIDPSDPDVMYIGTGEVYSTFQNTMPGIVNRFTRGLYGIGILKTEDGGLTWEKSLDWSYGDLRGVQDLAINPENPSTVYAATTEGLYRSYDAGASWTNIHPVQMAVNLLISPADTAVIFVTHGSLDPDLAFESGVFRSQDGGASFSKLTNGLPAQYSGKALLGVSLSNPDIIYASVQEYSLNSATTPLGLYRTENGGDSWVKASSLNVARFQGWYSHDVAVKPDAPNTIIYVGIDAFKSTNGGQNFLQTSFWNHWYFGYVPVGGPEGPSTYAHADIHGAYYHPTDFNTVFLATDGGVFVSLDNGESWEGRNGGYQSTQFYADFSNSTTDSLLAIGGMQDNATAVYRGEDAWWRVIGGDGLSAAINPIDDNIIYGTSQNLFLRRSTDRGFSFSLVFNPNNFGNETPAFNGAYALSHSHPNILYAGMQRIYKSINGGQNWLQVSSTQVHGNNRIVNITISPNDPNLLFVATSPDPFSGTLPPGVFKSTNGGQNWTAMTGLPDRLASDFAIDPTDQQIVYATFSGFYTEHVFKTVDGGENWFAIDNGLPDLPANSVVLDPDYPEIVYVGNDIGVYVSTDGGLSWELFSDEIPDAIMAMHLSVSPSNRKLRVATHGNGVYQADLRGLPVDTDAPTAVKKVILKQNYPNPVQASTAFEFELPAAADIDLACSTPPGAWSGR
jgi:photosystem II stability/assembly factor-like uncharacterized protein